MTDAPHADPDEGLLPEVEEARLYEYYGLPYSDIKSDTGLPGAGGTSSPGYESAGRDDARTRSGEELQIGTREREAGRARLRKWVETEHVATTVPVTREEVRIERAHRRWATRARSRSSRTGPSPSRCFRRDWSSRSGSSCVSGSSSASTPSPGPPGGGRSSA